MWCFIFTIICFILGFSLGFASCYFYFKKQKKSNKGLKNAK